MINSRILVFPSLFLLYTNIDVYVSTRHVDLEKAAKKKNNTHKEKDNLTTNRIIHLRREDITAPDTPCGCCCDDTCETCGTRELEGGWGLFARFFFGICFKWVEGMVGKGLLTEE